MSGSSNPQRVHPLTGEQLAPIAFIGKNGIKKFVWPVLGGSQPAGEPGDGTAGDGGAPGTDSTGGGAEGDGSGSTGTGTEDGSSGGGPTETDPERLRAIAKAANNQAAQERHAKKAAELKAAEALAKLQAIEDKDRSELEIAQRDLKTATEKVTGYEATISELRIANAFLTANKHTWQNPDSARKLADLSDVKIDDDGKVTGLDKALDKLAKEHPYLLKPQGNGQGGQAPGSSGAPAGSTGSGHNAKDSRAAIAARFPAATRRR